MVANLNQLIRGGEVYDISMPIEPSMTVYKNKAFKKPIFKTIASHDEGSHHETEITLNLHTGTHIDAPLHMIEDGSTMEIYDLKQFITPCRVIDLTHLNDCIRAKDLEPYDIKKEETILFKTKNSNETFFDFDFVYLESSGAKLLSEIGINGVGIDALGIERNQKDHSTHIQLLSKHIFILEGLRLKDVPEGEYILIALPLNISQVEGAMTRAVLIKA